jgi:uncharacterized protein
MQFTIEQGGGFTIDGYQPGEIRVNGSRYRHSVIVTPRSCEPWAIHHLEELRRQHFSAILAHRPDILLLGTGESQRFPEMRLYADVIAHGIGVEIMHSAAAARTFNLLVQEQRSVIAAIIL